MFVLIGLPDHFDNLVLVIEVDPSGIVRKAKFSPFNLITRFRGGQAAIRGVSRKEEDKGKGGNFLFVNVRRIKKTISGKDEMGRAGSFGGFITIAKRVKRRDLESLHN